MVRSSPVAPNQLRKQINVSSSTGDSGKVSIDAIVEPKVGDVVDACSWHWRASTAEIADADSMHQVVTENGFNEIITTRGSSV
jgi:hypothetical protein